MGGIAPDRLRAALVLAPPVGIGLAWLVLAGAPASYPAINATALALGLVWIAIGQAPREQKATALWLAALVALFALPLLTGPEVDGVRRWIPLGPANLHSGMLTLPACAVLAWRNAKVAIAATLLTVAIAALQPDPASALAIACGAGAACLGLRQPVLAIPAAAGGIVALITAPRAGLPPQPFVEGVVSDVMTRSAIAGLALLMLLLASIVLVATLAPLERPARLALAGTLAGFTVAALSGPYPTPLLGYGTSSILGLALALGLSSGLARARATLAKAHGSTTHHAALCPLAHLARLAGRRALADVVCDRAGDGRQADRGGSR